MSPPKSTHAASRGRSRRCLRATSRTSVDHRSRSFDVVVGVRGMLPIAAGAFYVGSGAGLEGLVNRSTQKPEGES